jgi:hypothetical protein
MISSVAISKPLKMKERLNTIKKVKLIEFMELDESKSNKLLAVFDKYDKKEIELHDELKSLSNQIAKSYDDYSIEDYKNVNNSLINLHEQIGDLKVDKSNEIRTLLTEKEFTKLSLFEYKFVKELRKRLIKRKLDKRNKK